MTDAGKEIQSGDRFGFGANWTRFLTVLNEERITKAEQSLREMLGCERLDGQRFVDVGSGSGLFSLAARRLGAQVVSFDYDPQSVACTNELRRRYFTDDPLWRVAQGSVLDKDWLTGLGQFDIVYSWGVLHHTGSMWQALANVTPLVASGGRLFIAIYNDQGNKSRRWAWIKRTYNQHPWARPFLLMDGLLRSWGLTVVKELFRLRPLSSWRQYGRERGMSPWWDVVDWVGGWPFEVATPEAVFRFYRDCGFHLQEIVTRQGYGCNEFVFVKEPIALPHSPSAHLP